MPLIAFGTDKARPAKKPATKPVDYAESLAGLRRVAAEIERKMALARIAAKQIGKDVALIRDGLGRLRMVFVESLDASERLSTGIKESVLKGLDREMGSEVNHLGGFRERGPRFGAWPAQGYAFPRRGFLAPMPRGYAQLYRTRTIPRSR